MPHLDEELTRELERVARPAAPDVERVVTDVRRRRARRRAVRRAAVVALGVVVVVGSAAGFLALTRIFDSPPPDRVPATLPGNGEIVFSRRGDDGRFHLFGVQPDGTGLRQITDNATDDTDPSVSPDGRTIAFTHALDDDRGIRVIAAIPIEGGVVTWVTDPELHAFDPAWSPTGDHIAFGGHRREGEDQRIYVMDPSGANVHPITDGTSFPYSPTWSPDGERIAFAAFHWSPTEGPTSRYDLYSVEVLDGHVQRLTDTPDLHETMPAWSPDGRLIAFNRQGELTVLDPATGDMAPVPLDGPITDPEWSPDGRYLAFGYLPGDADDIDVWRIAANGTGLRQLSNGGGENPSWQPVVQGSPAPSPTAMSEGRDLGLEFRMCFLERLGGIDFLGDGISGTAWVGAPVRENGTCGDSPGARRHVLAVDHTGDGLADSWVDLPPCYVRCFPFDATDLDANGTEELVVASAFSIQDYYFFTVGPSTDGELGLQPIEVAPPGHEPATIEPGKPLRIDAGGDAGYSSWIRCEGYPSSSVIVWTWIFGEIDGTTQEVHETRLRLEADGRFHVIGTNDFTIAATQDPGVERSESPACGVNWRAI